MKNIWNFWNYSNLCLSMHSMERLSYSATGICFARHIKGKGMKSHPFKSASMRVLVLVLLLVVDDEEISCMGWRSCSPVVSLVLLHLELHDLLVLNRLLHLELQVLPLLVPPMWIITFFQSVLPIPSCWNSLTPSCNL